MLMSQRLNAILPDNVYEELLMLAETEKRTKSQMAALLIEEAIATRKAQQNESPSPKKGKGAA
jgi:predicted transcriptional regulator